MPFVSVPNKEAIVAAGAIPALVQLLIVDRAGGRGRGGAEQNGDGGGGGGGGDSLSSRAMIAEQAARCVANLASCPTGRESLRESGAIPPLVQLLQPAREGRGEGKEGAAATEHAVWALASLANESVYNQAAIAGAGSSMEFSESMTMASAGSQVTYARQVIHLMFALRSSS